jgi:putative pyruvate formate lyase activating enzyme
MTSPDTWPSYLGLSEADWKNKIDDAKNLMSPCRLCPRECGVDRLSGEKGICKAGNIAQVSSHNDHHGEEPPLSGWKGSGTIFFTHCNLRCVFCQNYPISHLGNGKQTSAEELAGMMVALQERGCHNVNFVTPTHMMPFIIEAMPIAVLKGFKLPLVYNCGGYESMYALRILDGVIDIYLPDMKYSDNESAKIISSCPDYVEQNQKAILEMYRQVGDLETDDAGIAKRGLIIRHLVLPHNLAGSEKVIKFISEKVSVNTAISLMSQYFPAYKAYDLPEISRGPNSDEYEQAVQALEKYGLANGWVQD